MANKLSFNLAQSANTAPSANVLRMIGLSYLFGTNFEAVPSGTTGTPTILVDLGFSLSNLSAGAATYFQQLSYDTRCQGVNEYSDRPYAVKGYLAVVYERSTNVGNCNADLDDYERFTCTINTGATPDVGAITIGVCNTSQTDFYTPFQNSDTVVFFQFPDLGSVFQVQAQASRVNAPKANSPVLVNTNVPVIRNRPTLTAK